MEEFMVNLASFTSPRFSTAKVDRRKPLRGKLEADSGIVRWPINEYRFVSPRSLHFKVIQVADRTVLEGEFRLWLAFRVIVLGWLGIGIAWWVEQIVVGGLFYRAGWPLIREGVVAIVLAVAMAYVYTGICIFAGRRRERDMLRLLQTVLQGSGAAQVARDLLIRSL